MKDIYASAAGPVVLDKPETVALVGEDTGLTVPAENVQESAVVIPSREREFDAYGRDVTDWLCFEGDGRTGPFAMVPTKLRPHP